MTIYMWGLSGLVTDTTPSNRIEWEKGVPVSDAKKDWPPGFAKRTEATGGIEGAIVERWTPEQVELAKEQLGHEPSVEELRNIFLPKTTIH